MIYDSVNSIHGQTEFQISSVPIVHLPTSVSKKTIRSESKRRTESLCDSFATLDKYLTMTLRDTTANKRV